MNRAGVKILLQVLLPVLAIVAILLVYRSAGRRQRNEGRAVYEKHCANCHGSRGEGLRQLIPPLNDPRSLEFRNLVCTIRYGRSGPVTINGKVYNQPMPSNFKLENDEITAVINFIYNDLNSLSKRVSLPQVNAALETCRK